MLIVAWRDVASPQAGGSELLVDQLAAGLVARGDSVTLLCGGPASPHAYDVVRSGGPYTQFLRAPLAYRRLRDCDVVVEVCNGMPFLTPLWAGKPTVCMVNHVHTDLWPLRFRPPVSTVGQFLEQRVMPRVHRRNLIVTVSNSTAADLQALGVDRERIRMLNNGVAPAARRSPDPAPAVPGPGPAGRVQADRPAAAAVGAGPPGGGWPAGDRGRRPGARPPGGLAGPDVLFTGRISERRKHQLLGSAWLLLHPALIEGWGIVVTEAALRGTPTVGFDVPGLRDSVDDGHTGVLARTEAAYASAWAALALDPARREQLGAAARHHAAQLRWSTAVRHFSAVLDEALR